MLIKCPECELQVSDKALTCPHCGCPVTQNNKPRKKHRNSRRQRLPNGFGQISEIKGHNLRKPFRAMVTVGKTDLGKPICKPLKPEAYFETYNDAYAALVAYNQNPYDLGPEITMKELYERWSPKYYDTLKRRNQVRAYERAWEFCSAIYDMPVKDVRPRHIKGCIDEAESVFNKDKIKILFNILMDFAVEYEATDKNYARQFKLSKEVKKAINTRKTKHLSFTDEEMQLLWDNVDKIDGVDNLLIQCYSGWRPQEIGLIELKNVDIENWVFSGGMKTESGTNRPVPIHTKIRPLVEKKYKEAQKLGHKYLIYYPDPRTKNHKLSYYCFAKQVSDIVQELKLNPKHRAHDGRKHFSTIAKRNKLDEYAIKYLMGHAIEDMTEKTYTDRDISWLQEEIEKIK
ncbi:MAG: tyrosine-type recombinase/integrase [Lachnospiraceae bacterium]|nr:tyrosine-type recombinase/integrase [Lachnospiraceae bacterium]